MTHLETPSDPPSPTLPNSVGRKIHMWKRNKAKQKKLFPGSSYRKQTLHDFVSLAFFSLGFATASNMEWRKNYETHVRFVVGNRFGSFCANIFYWCIITGVINIAARPDNSRNVTRNIYVFISRCRLRPENVDKMSMFGQQFIDWPVAFFTLCFCVAALTNLLTKRFVNYANNMVERTLDVGSTGRLDCLRLRLAVIITRSIMLLIEHGKLQ